MKKIIMTAALVAVAAAVTAQTVTSANIVGYAKTTLTSGQFQMVAPQFQGSESGTTLGAAFSGMNDLSVVYVYNGVSYTKYTYYAGFGWYNDITQLPADSVIIGAGDAVWFEDSTGGADVVMAGEVPSSASITNSLAVGFNMVANPYPVALTLGQIPTSSLSDLDVIYVWNGSGYTKYTYYAGFAWYNDITQVDSSTVEIPVGQGFWLNSATGGSLILNKPF